MTVLLPLLAALGACDKPAGQNTAATTAVVVGTHMGAPALVDGSGELTKAVTDQLDPVLRTAGTLTLIINDGQPRVVDTLSLKAVSGTRVQQQDALLANRNKVKDAIKGAVPVHAQADPISALKLAGDAVRSKPHPQILVFDNGHATTGSVLMQTGVINADTDVKELADQAKGKLLGSFTGLPVRWTGLCSVSDPQPACPAIIQTQLQGFYRQLIADAGGTVTFDDTPLARGPARKAPVVDVIHWPTMRVTGTEAHRGNSPAQDIVEVLDESKINFLPNSDTYADAHRAQQEIRQLAGRLQANDYPSIEVVGCTAKDPGSSNTDMKRRGLSRARTILTDLRAHGATSRLTARSLGWRCPGFQPGDDAANRRVIVSSRHITEGDF